MSTATHLWLEPPAAPMTVLTGEFQDQAALAGGLNTLYDLGLPLLSLERVASEPQPMS